MEYQRVDHEKIVFGVLLLCLYIGRGMYNADRCTCSHSLLCASGRGITLERGS